VEKLIAALLISPLDLLIGDIHHGQAMLRIEVVNISVYQAVATYRIVGKLVKRNGESCWYTLLIAGKSNLLVLRRNATSLFNNGPLKMNYPAIRVGRRQGREYREYSSTEKLLKSVFYHDLYSSYVVCKKVIGR